MKSLSEEEVGELANGTAEQPIGSHAWCCAVVAFLENHAPALLSENTAQARRMVELEDWAHWALTAADRLAEVTPTGLLRTGIRAKADEGRLLLTKPTQGVGAHDAAPGKPVPGPWTSELIEGMGLHHRTAALVNRFAFHLAQKLRRSEVRYGWTDGWASDEWEDTCRRQLHEHAAKGDPLDVAAYAAFCWHHGWSSAHPDTQAEATAHQAQGGES